MVNFEGLGPGYKTWANAIVFRKDQIDDIFSITEETKDRSRLTAYFGSAFFQNKTFPQEG